VDLLDSSSVDRVFKNLFQNKHKELKTEEKITLRVIFKSVVDSIRFGISKL
jgi:hypothetical protein